MKVVLFLILIFLYFSSVKSSNSEADSFPVQPYFDAMNAQFQIYKETRYLQGHEHHNLDIKFQNGSKLSEDVVDCHLPGYLENNNTLHGSRRNGKKFGETSLVNFVMTAEMTGKIKCVSRKYPDESVSFFLFVAATHSNFFVKNEIRVLSENELQVQCIGGFFTRAVSLKIDGQESQQEYDPLEGFHIKPIDLSKSHFFECVHDSEIVSIAFGDTHTNFTGVIYDIEVKDFFITHSISCLQQASNQSINSNRTFVSCSNRDICLEPILEHRDENTIESSISISKKVDFVGNIICVFVRDDGNIVTRQQLVVFESSHFSPIICILIFILFIIFSIWFYLKNSKRIAEIVREKKFNSYLAKVDKKTLNLSDQNRIGTHKLFKCDLNGMQHRVAVKSSTNSEALKNELTILKKLLHPNIIQIIAISENGRSFSYYGSKIECLIYPFYEKLSLAEYFKNFSAVLADVPGMAFVSDDGKEKVTHFDLVSYSWQLASTLIYLKDMECTHLNISLKNVLLADNGIIKLTGFDAALMEIPQFSRTCSNLLSKLLGKYPKKQTAMIENIQLESIPAKFSPLVRLFGLLVLEIFEFGRNTTTRYSTGSFECEKPMHCPQIIFDDVIEQCFSDRPSDLKSHKAVLEQVLTNLSQEKFNELTDNLNKQKVRETVKIQFVEWDNDLTELLS